MVPNEPDVLLEGEGSLERAGGALPENASLRQEVLPHAALDGALGRLIYPGLQRNAAEPALCRSSEKAHVGEREELRDLQTRTKGNEVTREVGQEQKMRAHKEICALTPGKYESLSLRASAAHQAAPCVSWVLRVRCA